VLDTDIHHAYITDPKHGTLHPAGRFIVHAGQLKHLEDYHGLLDKELPEGYIDDYILAKLGHPGSGLKIASRKAIRGGHRLDVVPEAELDQLPAPPPAPTPQQLQNHVVQKPPGVWHYTRAGHDQPHVLESKEGKFLLDGNPLEHHEVATILDNVRSKAGKIRYVRGMNTERAIAKMEQVFQSLRKNDDDMSIDDALAHLDSIAMDDKTRRAIATMRRGAYQDPMVPGLGNKPAYMDWAQKQQPGVTVMGDANYFKSINDELSHAHGDAAIKAMGTAWRDAAAEVGQGKAHRFGGDEFHAHFPTYEHAASFARNLRGRLEQIPPLAGTHKVSMGLGIGHNFDSADKALYHAKAQKAPTLSGTPSLLAHSLHPGFEGPVPLNPDQLHIHPPDVGVRPHPAEAAAPSTPAPAAPSVSPPHAA
jgi:diguanylate cyclase (GGDEF)-like protein